MTWYCVYTTPKAELLAANELWLAGYESLCLHYRVTVRPQNRKREVLKAYYPRYIFANIRPGQSFYHATKCRGVGEIIRMAGSYLEIPDSVIAAERSRGTPEGLIELPPEQARERMRRGSRLRIMSGPFAGLLGIVELDTGSAIGVWLNLLGRPLQVELAPSALAV